MTIDDILCYILVHCTPVLLEPMCSPIPDDHSHHVASEAWLVDIFWGAPTGVTLHHW